MLLVSVILGDLVQAITTALMLRLIIPGEQGFTAGNENMVDLQTQRPRLMLSNWVGDI